jgi:hypothetical protein
MKEFSPNSLETAEQRATRTWRNAQITKKIQQPSTIVQVPVTDNDTKKFLRIKRKCHSEIMSVFETNRKNLLAYYKASTSHTKRMLLLEKLRRLELNNE